MMSARTEFDPSSGDWRVETADSTYEECMQMAQLFLLAAGDAGDAAIKACHRQLALTWLDAARKKQMH